MLTRGEYFFIFLGLIFKKIDKMSLELLGLLLELLLELLLLLLYAFIT